MTLIQQPGLVGRRKVGGQIDIDRQMDELDRSSVERRRVPR